MGGGTHGTVVIPASSTTVSGIVNNEQYWCCLANAQASRPQTDGTKKRL